MEIIHPAKRPLDLILKHLHPPQILTNAPTHIPHLLIVTDPIPLTRQTTFVVIKPEEIPLLVVDERIAVVVVAELPAVLFDARRGERADVVGVAPASILRFGAVVEAGGGVVARPARWACGADVDSAEGEVVI